MTWDEKNAVFRQQIALGMIKRCQRCQQVHPVKSFLVYGGPLCADCLTAAGSAVEFVMGTTG